MSDIAKSSVARLGVLPITALAGLTTAVVAIAYGGNIAYGVVALLGQLFQLVPFADLGIGAAIVPVLANAQRTPRDAAIARATLRRAFITLCVTGAAVALIGIGLTSLGAWSTLLSLPPSVALEEATIWISILFGLSLPLGVGQRVLLGLSKNHISALVAVIGPLVTLGLTVLLAYNASPPVMLAVAPVAGVLATAATASTVGVLIVRRTLPGFFSGAKGEGPRGRHADSISLHIYATPMFFIGLAVPLAMQSHRLFVAHLSSAGELAEYSIAAQFYFPLLSIITVGSASLWPIFARQEEDQANQWRQALIVFALAGLGLGTGFLLLASPIASLISGGMISVGSDLATAFGLLIVVMSTHQASGMLLTDPRGLVIQAWLSVAMALATIALAWWLTPTAGAAGPVWAMIIALTAFMLAPCIMIASRRLRPSSDEQTTVVVADPNDENPYGVELAALLSSTGRRVVLYSANRVLPSGVVCRPVLGGSVRTRRGVSVRHALRRMVGPLKVAWSARSGRILLIVWLRDAWDVTVYTLSRLLGVRVVVIEHNPGTRRTRAGIVGRLHEHFISHATVVIAHRDEHRAVSVSRPESFKVASHPPYQVTVGQRQWAPSGPESPSRPRVALIGALRPDKGSDDLPTIVESALACGAPMFEVIVLGRDPLPDTLSGAIQRLGVETVHHGNLSDQRLLDELAIAHVMLAPYRSVTESGSVHLALQFGMPILAYRHEGLDGLLLPGALASSPSDLGRLLARSLRDPWPTARVSSADLRQRATSEWSAALSPLDARYHSARRARMEPL